jgi:hypothetical protein
VFRSDPVGQKGVGAFDSADAPEPQFLRQPPLPGSELALLGVPNVKALLKALSESCKPLR